MRALAHSAILLFLTVASGSTFAQDREPIDVDVLGPQVGDIVPDFELRDQHGQLQTLESVRGPNGSLILFYRSADW